MRRLLLLFAATIVFVIPALAATSPEFMLVPPAYTSAEGWQGGPSVASDGSSFLAAWTDPRLGSNVQRIVASRLAEDGTPLEPTGIMLSAEQSGEARVVFAGGNYFVMWQTGSGAGAVRISRDGVVLDAQPMHPLPEPSFFTGAIATNGTETAVIWQTAKLETRVAVLDNNGEMIADVELPALGAQENDRGPQIAWNGSAFVVARVINTCYECPAAARLYIVTPGGGLTGPIVTPPVVEDGRYSMAALGDRILIVSATWRKGFNGWLFENDGAQVGGTIGFAWNSPTLGERVAITTDGGSFILAWTELGGEGLRIVARRIDRDGNTPPDPTVVASSASSLGQMAIARNPAGGFIAMWRAVAGWDAVQSDVFARPLSATLQPLGSERLVTYSASAQDRPSIAWNGSTWLVAWYEHEGSYGERLVVMRRGRDGTAVDAAPVAVTARALKYSYERRRVTIASDGRDFLVAWIEGSKILMRRLSGEGTWLDAEATIVANDVLDLTTRALAWNGREYFLVWSRSSYDPWVFGVFGVRIGADGIVSAPIPISPEQTLTREPMLVRLGDGWLVVWTYVPPYPCQILCVEGDSDVVATRVTFDGTVFEIAPIQISTRHTETTQGDYANALSVASSGESALVTWSDIEGVRAARVHSNGIISDSPDGNGTQLFEEATGELDTAWDGTHYLLLRSSALASGETSVILHRIRNDEALSPLGEGEEISRGMTTSDAGTRLVAIAARPNGGALLVYPRIVFGPAYGGVRRLLGRVIAGRGRTNPIRK